MVLCYIYWVFELEDSDNDLFDMINIGFREDVFLNNYIYKEFG